MPTDQPPNVPPTAPPDDAPAAPSPTIDIVEPEAPAHRPYRTPPTLISDEELAALAAKRMAESDRAARERQATPTSITDGEVEITVDGDRIVPRRVGDPKPANVAIPAHAPLTPRAMSKREAEMEAGRRAVAHAEEARMRFPPAPKSAQEIAAEGQTNPVFRPGDFQEYRNMRAGTTSKDSGSSMLQRVKGTLPEA